MNSSMSKKGVTNGDRTQSKGKSKSKRLTNAYFRCCFFFAAIVTMLLPLVYVDLNVATIDHEQQQTFTFKKNLDGFQKMSSQKNLTISAAKSSDFDAQAKKGSTGTASFVDHNKDENSNLVLTAYLELPETLIETGNTNNPLVRNTSSSRLRSVSFPNTGNCTTLMQNFPVDDFPLDDPFLPWIHDYFPSVDRRSLHFVAQNRRKCDTGVHNKQTMKFWTPQVALFQGIPIVVRTAATSTQQSKGEIPENNATIFQLSSSFREATHNSTRFQCRFHHDNITITTLSVFPFDYEFVHWIRGGQPMLDANGERSATAFWLNQLKFNCPIPEVFQPLLLSSSSENGPKNNNQQPSLYIDLIPIRTPVLRKFSLLSSSTGTDGVDETLNNIFGRNHILPPMDDAGRWQNLPICRRSDNLLLFSGRSSDRDQSHHLPATDTTIEKEKPYRLVACTWTSSSYQRRGDSVSISDSAKRLREWIQFHLMVGFDHVYVYDNTNPDVDVDIDTAKNGNTSSIHDITQSFGRDQATYHAWPCKICNNNRPAHDNPGIRSSQYAAESSCRTRYGELSEWMTFIDTDEYLVPLKQKEDGEYSWHPVMDEMEKMNISIMKLLSSRGKLRSELTETLKDQSVCNDPNDIPKKTKQLPVEPCVGPMKNITFLQMYNCEYIRPPKPNRFHRAMKQIYRPSFVLSHFVHYSTVTADTQSYSDFMRRHPNKDPRQYFHREEKSTERSVDEMTQGALVHARSILPHETRRRSAECSIGSKHSCSLGFLCGDDVEYVDDLHKDNVFHNFDGSFCNCWRNKVVDEVLVPKLETLLLSRP